MGEKPKIVGKLLATKWISGMISTFRQWVVHKSRRALAGTKYSSTGAHVFFYQNKFLRASYTLKPDDGAHNCNN